MKPVLCPVVVGREMETAALRTALRMPKVTGAEWWS